ncbi:MAG: hypothetical protein IJF17_02365 [Thermoguttaceae bacterium]|nr:hypothetical protein [Thermoguttaceae bacterium]
MAEFMFKSSLDLFGDSYDHFEFAGGGYFIGKEWFMENGLGSYRYILLEGPPSFEISGDGIVSSTLEFSGMRNGQPYFTDGQYTLWTHWLTITSYPREPAQWDGFYVELLPEGGSEVREVRTGDTYWVAPTGFSPWGTVKDTVFTLCPAYGDQSFSDCTVSRDLSKFYTSDTLLGLYSCADGSGKKKLVGIPVWKDQNDVEYQRSHDNDGPDNSFTYGGIHEFLFGTWRWILGEHGDENGWWESAAAPSLTEPVTFTFCKNENSEATGEDLTLTFSHCVEYGKKEILLGEVARWL